MTGNSDSTDSGTGTGGRAIDRRSFVKGVGATGVAAGIAGCGGDGNGGNGNGATPGGNGNGDGATTIQLASLPDWAEMEDEFNQQLHDAGMSEDITVDVLSGGAVTDERQSQYRQWLSSGRSEPDMFMMDSGWTIPFIARGQLLNLDEAIPGELLDTARNDYFEMSVDTATGPDGNLFGIPIFPDFPTIQYRKDILENAGYDWEQYATDPISWQQFSNELEDAYEQSDVEYGFTWQGAAAEQLSCCVFNEYLSSWGGAYFGNPEENLYTNIGERPITVDEEPVVNSVRMARTFIHGSDAENTLDDYGNISPEAVQQWSTEPSREPFTSGNAVAVRNWPYSIALSGAEDALGEDQGVMPVPYGVPEGEGNYPGTGGSIAALGGWHLSLNPNSDKVDACVDFIRAMMTEQFMKDTFESVGWMPPNPDVLADSTDIPVMGRHVDTLSYAGEHSMPRPTTVLWPDQSDQIGQEVNAALDDKAPSEAMSDLRDSIESIEDSYEGT